MFKFFKRLISTNYCVNSNNIIQSSGNVSIGDNTNNKSSFSYFSKNSKITINGKTYSGSSHTIINDKIFIDGKEIIDDNLKSSKILNIKIEGGISECAILNCNSIQVIGNVKNLDNQNGDISITGNIEGDVDNQNGDIQCQNINGDIDIQNGSVYKNKH